MNKSKLISVIILSLTLTYCSIDNSTKKISNEVFRDTTFFQEYHIGHTIGVSERENDVRSIAVDSLQNIWIATRNGVFVKLNNSEKWKTVQNTQDRGPSFSVETDNENNVWFGTWNGLYKYKDNDIKKIEKVIPPISTICATEDGVYAFGHYGIWLINGSTIKKLNLNISKGIRDAVSDNSGGLWIASDVGLYHYSNDEIKLYQDENELISCYLRGVSYSNDGKLWAGGLGGVAIRDESKKLATLTPKEGISNAEINCVEKSPEGTMWVGTNMGTVRYSEDGSYSLRFSKRWLMNDEVRDIAFDKEQTAWVATAGGVSAIKKTEMTLAKKAEYFYDRMMKVHVREPWIVHRVELEIEGDSSSWKPIDDDNDGEYTAIYLSMESLRYAVTGNPDAKEKARKAFRTLKFLQEITETDGFFARSVVPLDWTTVNDINRKYTKREAAEELVKDPRFKIVENRWRKSNDGKWLWKGDTSSDEMCGHFMGYFYYSEFAADDEEKEILRKHVKKILDYLMAHNYNFIDIDGEPTRWAVWSPDKLNRDPDWASERSLNSFELLSFLKFGYHITGDEKYQFEYLRLINEEGYLENISKLNKKNPAWEIYFDIPMAGYLFPILVKYEKDPDLKKYFEDLMDEWFENQVSGKNPLNNFIYCYSRDKRVEIKNSIDFLIDTPLDLVDYFMDQTTREDIKIVREPILEEKQINLLVPASERSTVRWDKNPWGAIRGNPYSEREPVFWLFPYWMAKYLEIIKN